MDILYGKLDIIIKLLEDLVDQTQPAEEVMIEIPNLPRSPTISYGEDGSVLMDDREEEYLNQHVTNIEVDNALYIGKKHRLLEQADERGIVNLYIQYWDDRDQEWANIHKF